MTALHFACQRGHIKVVQKLLKAGCDLTKRNNSKHNPHELGDTPLHLACVKGRTQVVEALLKYEQGTKSLKRKYVSIAVE